MARSRPEVVFPPLPLDRRGGLSIPSQVYLALRRGILDGRIPAGARLPASRELAGALGVARQGVVAAYERLVAEGFVESRVGSGTRVATGIAVSPTTARTAARRRPRLSSAARRVGRLPLQLSPWRGPLRPLRTGTPALDVAPLTLWGRLLRSACLRARPSALDYGDALGLPELRRAIAERLYRARAIACGAEQVVITASAQQALDLVARLLVQPGDPVWFAEPGYSGARGAWTAAGARLVPVPVDGEGIAVAVGARRAPRARLAYVTPSHQFPTGVTMGLDRRLALLDWARRAGAFVVEDDYDSEFVYEGRPLAALFGLAEDSRVVYVGTFSKALFPALRLGFLVLPAELVEPCRALRHFGDGFPPTLIQQAAARLLAEGHFDRHLRRAIRVCRERRDALVAAVRRRLPPGYEIEPPRAGLHAVLWLPRGMDDRGAAQAAAEAGVETIAVSAFARRRLARGGLVLGFAAFPPREIERAVERLAEALRRAGAG